MEQERMELTVKEIDRLRVIHQVIIRELKAREAAEQLGMSVRQVRRLKNKVGQGGYRAISHGLRGRPSNHRLAEGLVEAAVAHVLLKYADFGPTFANEKLSEVDGFELSTSSLRRGMMRIGLWKARKQNIQYRSCRERKACLGELVQLDGSDHQWFEERGERCVLITFIDDATSRILHAEFVRVEDTMTLLWATRKYLLKWGRPLAFYVDRDSIYKVNREQTVEEELRDARPLSQFSRAMEELGIQIIPANSPQAKGRVERGFKTHQDRLVKELRLASISDQAAGNAFLSKIYVAKHNRKRTVQPRSNVDAHRPLLAAHRLEEVLSVRLERTVNNDFTVRFKNLFLQILPNQKVRPSAKVLVEVRLDGSMHIRHNKGYLAYRLIEKPLPALKRVPSSFAKKLPTKTRPAASHPWREFFVSKKNAIEDYERQRKPAQK